jgi:DNA replication protein DnaC
MEGKTLYKITIKYDDDHEEVKSLCRDCYDEARTNQEVVEAKKIEQENLKLNQSLANVPKIFGTMTMEQFIDDPVMLHKYFSSDEMKRIAGIKEIMRKFLDAVRSGEGVMIALVGDYGTGKTLVASVCVNILIAEGRKARFEHTGLLIKRLMSNEVYEGTILSLVENDLVVLDEINSTNVSQFTERALSDMINAIYSSRKSLILTANGTGSELKKYIGEKGYDRIQESPSGGIVRCKWPSFRGTDVQSK